ncbi:MAG: hypothetical protein LUQ65_00345 [Candidatus Helarchaeota archaeon]|nr:hypothetical protein [Candidatus Helarchaeota archaeon]
MPETPNETEGKNSINCIICNKEIPSGDYCKYHQEAYQNLKENYNEWLEAFGELTFDEYLQKLLANPDTGLWVKEVAENLAKKEKEK